MRKMLRRPSLEKKYMFSPILTLAFWHLRRTCLLLLCMLPGVLAALLIACGVPLFSQVMATVSLHSTLATTSDTSTLTVTASTTGISTQVLEAIEQQFATFFSQPLRSYLSAPPQLSLTLPDIGLSLTAPASHVVVGYYATETQQAAAHLLLVQGHFSHNDEQRVGVLVSPETARSWNITVGTPFKLRFTYNDTTDALTSFQAVWQHEHVVTMDAYIAGLITVPPDAASGQCVARLSNLCDALCL